MTEKREFHAASVDEAVARAVRDLGIDQDDLSYRVVDEGNTGFLGIGVRDARIEVEAPAVANKPALASEPAGPTPSNAPAEKSSVGELEETSPPVQDVDEDDSEPNPIGPTDASEDAEAEPVPRDALDETQERVSALLGAMGFEARLDVYDAGGYVAADVAPDNTALFIGQKGETIDALQYLVNASVNRKRSSRVRVVLDAEGYRQRRVEALQGMAHRTARKALREDRAVELPPMNPAERRVVHLFLRDNPRVTTESEGTGDARRIRISPI